MPQVTNDQLVAMNETLCTVMDMRLNLTRIEEIDKKTGKSSSKYCPTVKWKEHFISHAMSDIKALAPLPLLNTDTFESKAQYIYIRIVISFVTFDSFFA